MKKLLQSCLAISMLFTLCSCTALAARPGAGPAGGFGGFTGPGGPQSRGGYTGSGQGISTVAEALRMEDDSYAALRGKLERHVRGEHYIFRDGTGSVTVDIDHDKWAGQEISPNDTVTIYVEVDKDWNHTELDVKRIVKDTR